MPAKRAATNAATIENRRRERSPLAPETLRITPDIRGDGILFPASWKRAFPRGPPMHVMRQRLAFTWPPKAKGLAVILQIVRPR